jgi:hypothetical protein
MIRKGEYPSFYLVELVSFYFKFTMKGYKPAPVKRHPRDVLRLHRAERDQHAGRGGGAVFQLNPFGILILPEQPSTIGCLAFDDAVHHCWQHPAALDREDRICPG